MWIERLTTAAPAWGEGRGTMQKAARPWRGAASRSWEGPNP